MEKYEDWKKKNLVVKRSEATSSGPERTKHQRPRPSARPYEFVVFPRPSWSLVVRRAELQFFPPPSVSRARIFCSAWSRVCVLLFNNTGSPCACQRACVSLCIGGRSCAMIFYDRVAVPQSPQLAIPFYRCNKVIFLSLSLSRYYICVYNLM